MIHCRVLTIAALAISTLTVNIGVFAAPAQADSIVWLAEKNPGMNDVARTTTEMNGILADFNQAADKAGIKGVVVQEYPEIGVFVVSTDLAGVRTIIGELQSLARDTTNKQKPQFEATVNELEAAIKTEDYSVALSDAGCSENGPSAVASKLTPPNIQRVGGGTENLSYTRKAWILDTGIDGKLTNAESTFNVPFLTIDTSLGTNCKSGTCQTAGYKKDVIGHGTIVAGIIGGKAGKKNAGDADIGILGVSPGVTIVPVKVFNSKGTSKLSKGPLAGLDYVAAKGRSGDVVNVSWGVVWTENMRKGYLTREAKPLMDRVRLLADKGLYVVVAAGNTNPDDHAPWVQLVAPANTTGYVGKSASGGKVFAVAAVESKKVSNIWVDTLWKDDDAMSNYGLGRPNDPGKGIIAEPGVDVQGLWSFDGGAATSNSCTGTSFAAAHLSGILVRQSVSDPQTVPTERIAGDPLETQSGSPNDGMRVGTVP